MKELEKIIASISRLEREIERLKVGERYQYPLWQNYTPAGYAGWTALPGGTYRYALFGNVVFLVINMTSGTSNGTNAVISLPYQASGQTFTGANGYAIDNGTGLTTMSRWAIAPNSTMIDFYKDAAVGAWTASGTKRINCVAIYERS